VRLPIPASQILAKVEGQVQVVIPGSQVSGTGAGGGTASAEPKKKSAAELQRAAVAAEMAASQRELKAGLEELKAGTAGTGVTAESLYLARAKRLSQAIADHPEIAAAQKAEVEAAIRTMRAKAKQAANAAAKAAAPPPAPSPANPPADRADGGKKKKGQGTGSALPGDKPMAGETQRVLKQKVEAGVVTQAQLVVDQVSAMGEVLRTTHDSVEGIIQQTKKTFTGRSPLAQYREQRMIAEQGFKQQKAALSPNDLGFGLAALQQKQAGMLRGLSKLPLLQQLGAPQQKAIQDLLEEQALTLETQAGRSRTLGAAAIQEQARRNFRDRVKAQRLALAAGLPERSVPEALAREIVRRLAPGFRLVITGRSYDRHGRSELRKWPQAEGDIVDVVDRLSVPGTCALVQASAGLVTCHSALNLLAWNLRKPQLLLYPRSAWERHIRVPDQWAFGIGYPETVHAAFEDCTEWPQIASLVDRFEAVLNHGNNLKPHAASAAGETCGQ